VNSYQTQTIPSRIALPVSAPISGQKCVLGTAVREAADVRDRAFTGAVMGLTTAVKGAFPGPDAWSPPI